MPTTQVDLYTLFKAVNQALKDNKTSLNEADSYNHDHGNNMVNNFKVITKALKERKGASPTDQLAYASQVLSRSSNSGSAQMYSQGLAQAATRLKGQPAVTSANAMDLVQALLGGGQQPEQPTQPGSGDMMGQLLGSLMGGGAPTEQPMQPPDSQPPDLLGGLMGALLGGESPTPQTSHPQAQQSDPLGGLMGALMGGESPAPQTPHPPAQQADPLGGLMGALMGDSSGDQPTYSSSAGQSHTPSAPSTPSGQQPDILGGLMGALLGGDSSQGQANTPPSAPQSGGGLNLNTLLTGAMAYMQASQQGAAPLDALIQAVMAGSQMNSTPHQAQSGQLVAGTLINTLGGLLGGKGN
jgi:hypothetical protein